MEYGSATSKFEVATDTFRDRSYVEHLSTGMRSRDDKGEVSSPVKAPRWGVAAALLVATGLVLIGGSLWWFYEQSLPLPTPHPYDPYWATPHGIRDINLVCIRVCTYFVALLVGLPTAGVVILSADREWRARER